MIKDRFFDRKQYLDILQKRVMALKDGYRQNIAIIADELVGKTSVIFKFLNSFCDNRIIMVYLEARPESLSVFANRFICNIHLDYLQMQKKRCIRIIGSKGSLDCDLVKKKISILITNQKELTLKNPELFDIERTYIDELKNFIVSLEKDLKPGITIDDGIKALKLIKG